MKNKLKRNPFLHTAIILLTLFIITVVLAIGMFYYVFSISEPEGLSLASWPNTFANNFSAWIEEKDGIIGVEEIGVERLDEYGLWVQILDETGQELYAHNKPTHYPESYSMSELIALAESGYENGNTVFISSTEVSGRTLNYIVGFPYAIGKHMLYYNGENVARLSPLAKNVMIVAVCIVVVCAFCYTLWLSRKLSTITKGIVGISSRDYKPVKETGVFGEIYSSLNQMDMELERSSKIQEETERTRQEWIANITHDLKTPLSPIKGYAELLTDGNATEVQTVQEYGTVILKNVEHMEKLLNDLKLTYQLEAGAIPFNPQQVRVERFLKELVIDIANDPVFSKRTIEFESHVPEHMAELDASLLRRAIGNIIINALVHNPVETQIQITVHKTSENELSLSIRDNGRGMDEAEQSVLWSRYYRGTSTKEKPEGSGLGLAIAKQVVVLHGGDIRVRSRIGEGTEFIITLPLVKEGNAN